jgi:hypothetical protein
VTAFAGTWWLQHYTSLAGLMSTGAPTAQRGGPSLSLGEQEHMQHENQLREKLRSDLEMFKAPNLSVNEKGRLLTRDEYQHLINIRDAWG